MIVIKMNKLMKFLALTAIISLAGCMMGPNYQHPAIETPESYRFAVPDTETELNLKWWKLFNDPNLNILVVTALDNNKDIKIAASRIEEARASFGFTRADQYPRLDIEAGASRGDYTGGRKTPSTDNSFFIAPTLSWEIDFWGKFRRATEAKQAELLASDYSLRTVQISLISVVAGTYFQLLDFRHRLEISEQTLESRIDSLDIIEKKFNKGIIPEIDVNQAQIQKEIAAAAIPVFERSISSTENTLNILLGRLPGEIKKDAGLNDQIFPDIPVGLPSSLLERRPDIMTAEYLLKAQTAEIGVAEAMRFPSVNLTGILGFASDDLSDLISHGDAWSIGGSLFGPVYDFNKNKLRVVIEEEQAKQALYTYENTILQAFREVDDALNEIRTYKNQIASVERKLTAAANATTLSTLRYDQGFASYLEVLDSERTLFSVELELSELKQQYHNSYVRLYKALGGGWLSKEEMTTARQQMP